MANAGVKAGEAGNQLKGAMVNLVKPTDQMAAVMNRYGISIAKNEEQVQQYEKELIAQAKAEDKAAGGKGTLTKAQQKAIHTATLEKAEMGSLKDTLELLREKMGGLTEAEQANAVATIFGKQNMAGMLAIINASETDFNKLSGAISNSSGEAERMATAMEAGLGGAMRSFGSASEGVKIQIGETFAPLKEFAVRGVTDSLQTLTADLGAIGKDFDNFGAHLGQNTELFKESWRYLDNIEADLGQNVATLGGAIATLGDAGIKGAEGGKKLYAMYSIAD